MDFIPTMPLQLLERVQEYIIAATFPMARMTGLIIVMPVFTRLGLTGTVRGAIAFAFTLPLLPMAVGALASQHMPVIKMAALLPKEVAVGVIIGLILGVPMWAAEAAGDILDVQRGSSSSNLPDPSGASEAGITGTLLTLIMVALYFGSGGLPLTLRTVYESYEIWPIVNVTPTLGPAAGEFFLTLLDNVMAMGLMLVGPIVVFMLLADLLLALVSRAAPNLNVFALSLSTKNFIFALLLVLYSAFMLKYMRDDLSILLHGGSDIKNLVK